MSSDTTPRVAIVAGINGAGKTTASVSILRNMLQMPTFVNADAIARGLNGFNVESVALSAGRIMLERLHELAAAREDFSFETTMAGKSYARWLESLRATGYYVYLYYYWLRSPEVAITRVATRVQAGGHHVPDATVRQRYSRSVSNFLNLYRQQADYWEVHDNTNPSRVLVAMGSTDDELLVGDEELWEAFQRSASDE